MRDIIIYDIVIPSLQKLYKEDYDNIRFGVSERNICGRLALHMENNMRQYDKENDSESFVRFFADVEYNRMGNGDLKHYKNNDHAQYMVSDLLIHNRRAERNLLAVEMKRKGNIIGVKEDRQRLVSLVSSQTKNEEIPCVHNTMVGAFIIYSPKDLKIELYESVHGDGIKIGEICFDYHPDGNEVLLLRKNTVGIRQIQYHCH